MWRTLRSWLRRSSFEDEMRDEMRFHLESRAADLERRGFSRSAAARQAQLEFGSIEKQKDLARASAGVRILDEAIGDVRYALRMFARNKSFAVAAIVTLALGIGANTSIFTLIDALVLRTLPVSHPEQLLQLRLGSAKDPEGDASFSYAMTRALDARRDLFAGVAGFSSVPLSTGQGDTLRRVRAAAVTGAFYDMLGLRPAAGRLLTRADDVAGAPLVAVASFGYWQHEWSRSPSTIGSRILVDGVPVEIVGVSPRGFSGANVGDVADITVPVAAIGRLNPNWVPLLDRGNSWLRVLARPRAGITESQLNAGLAAAWPRVAEEAIDPKWPPFRKAMVSDAVIRVSSGATGWTYLRELYVKPLRVLMGGVSLVLLIVCANVASLLLARASARRREIAVRMAIGASRARVFRQLLLESLILALIGAALGIVLATTASRLLVDLIGHGAYELVFDLTPDWRVIAFTTAIASFTALLFGAAPALQATAPGFGAALKEDARLGTARLRLLPSLVAAQVALSLVLLIGAGLFVQTLRNLQMVDPGFRPEGVWFVEFERAPDRLPAGILERVKAIPGIVSASLVTQTPLSGSTWSEPVVPAGQALPERDNAVVIGAAPEFFTTIGTALVSGRDFSVDDSPASAAVAIVNQRYADTYFPHRNPIGQLLTATINGRRRDLEIVGVARAVNTNGLRETPPRIVYVPYAQVTGSTSTNVVVRAAASPELFAALRRTLQPLAPLTPLEVRALSEQVREATGREQLMAALAAAFGALALGLAAVGIYGLLAYAVARRTREIGIRMALGAQRGGVVALVLRGAQAPLGIGIAVGLPVAWMASRAIESLLFGLTGTDAAAMGGAVATLLLVAHVAAWLPARRAARVDPLVALRSE
jgi:putative ABC transport system permease protein